MRVWVAVLAAAAVVIGGVIVVVNAWPNGSKSDSGVSALKATLDDVPLPAGSKLVDESAIEAHGDVQAIVQREYHLPSAGDSSAQLRSALDGGGYQLVNPHTKQVDPTVWDTATSADGGDVYVLPPDASGDGIELRWQGARLEMSVQPGDVR